MSLGKAVRPIAFANLLIGLLAWGVIWGVWSATAADAPSGNDLGMREVRGRAYVQNHPDPAGERVYDAVNEVWFDDLAGLRARVEWFRANLSGPAGSGPAGSGPVGSGPAEADLVRQSWFIAVREHVVLA